MGMRWLQRVLLCGVLLYAANAWSAEIHGRSSTQFLWFNNIFNNNKQTEFAEYLQVSVTKIDKEGKAAIYGYGRGSQDMTNGDGLNGRLYFLYGQYRDLFEKIDLRVGRQFVNIAAGSSIIDGGQVELKNVGPIAFTLFGGRNVIFGESGELSGRGDAVLGLAGYLVGFKAVDLELGYFAKWQESELVRETLGASGKWYLLNSVKLYGNTRYDLNSEVFSEVLAGVKYFPTSNLIFTAEWFQSYPTFDADSIYAVFAVNRYQEGVFRADYRINDMFSVNAGYNRQDYGDDAAADVYELGFRVRPIEHLQLALNYDKRNGYNGSQDGWTFDVSYEATKDMELAAGIQYDVYQREDFVNTGSEIARKYWAGAKYKLSKKMNASIRVEDNVNRSYSENWQGRIVFNYDF